jgi:hypothetical protein
VVVPAGCPCGRVCACVRVRVRVRARVGRGLVRYFRQASPKVTRLIRFLQTYPWKDHTASGSVRFRPMYAAAPDSHSTHKNTAQNIKNHSRPTATPLGPWASHQAHDGNGEGTALADRFASGKAHTTSVRGPLSTHRVLSTQGQR